MFVLGGIVLDCPPTRENYHKEHIIVAGREATSLSGRPMSLGVIRKYIWTLIFYPGNQYDAIMALEGSDTTFVDHDGSSYTVTISGTPVVEGYPAEIGQMTLTLREV